jgi:DedD protein
MGLFSFLRKNKQESASSEGAFFSRAEEESNAIRGRGKRKQGNQPADPVLPEKKRARRRLVGAIALVLAMIIGLPMILDSEPKPLADDIAIQIPSKDKAIPSGGNHQAAASPSYSLAASAAPDKKQDMADAPNAPIAAAGAAVSVPAPATGTTDAAKSPDTGKSSGSEKTAPNPQFATKIDSNKEAEQISKIEPQAAAQAAGKVDDTARATAILEGKPDVKESAAKAAIDKKDGKFVVQVAALATQEKVNELQGRLKDAGVKSYTQKVATESGARTRIRVGPFPTKEEAEKLRAKLAKLGLHSSLIPGSH